MLFNSTLSKKINYTYKHKARKAAALIISISILLFRISLQFSCNFINNKRPLIYSLKYDAEVARLFLSGLYTLYSIANFNQNNKQELTKTVGTIANFLHTIIEILIQFKIVNLFFNNNINCVRLTSTILFLFISEPISLYYSYQEYQSNKNTEKQHKYRKSLIFNTLIFSFGLLNFLCKRIEDISAPINLSSNVVYNFNLSVTISMIYSAIFIVRQVDNILSNAPPSELQSDEIDQVNSTINNL